MVEEVKKKMQNLVIEVKSEKLFSIVSTKAQHTILTAPHTETNSLYWTETNDCLISTKTNSL